jgi:hypothetical protein
MPPADGAPQRHRDGAIIAVPAVLDNSLLRWQPYGCRLLNESEYDACREKLQHVCFFGDSQMRHLFNSFVNPSFNTNGSQSDNVRPTSDKRQYTWPTYTYKDMTWGHEFGGYNLSNCSSIIANFGLTLGSGPFRSSPTSPSMVPASRGLGPRPGTYCRWTCSPSSCRLPSTLASASGGSPLGVTRTLNGKSAAKTSAPTHTCCCSTALQQPLCMRTGSPS